MSYLPSRHNLTSRITASLLVILYILTLGPLKETLASVIPQSPLPVPILSSQITTGRIPNTYYNSSLLTGWQMLGYPSKNKTKVSDAFSNLVKGVNYDRISRYDKSANTFVDLTPADYLEIWEFWGQLTREHNYIGTKDEKKGKAGAIWRRGRATELIFKK